MVGARTTAAMAVLTILMLMGWMFWLGTSISMSNWLEELNSRYNGLSSEYSRLKSERESLQSNYRSLQSEYDKLSFSYGALESEYSILRIEHEILGSKHSEIQSEYFLMRSSYESEYSKYSKLQSEYSSIKSSYESLMREHEELEKQYEILKSVSWISEDGRIKVTYELIPQHWWREISYYDLKVDVTNVGDKPLKNVLVFVFAYADGRLVEWKYYKFNDLYMGETLTYTFQHLSKELTSYRVLAIGSE